MLIGVLAVVIKLYLTDERLRSIIEPALEEQLNRDVSIGRLEVRLLRSFPNLSIGIEQLAIHTPPVGEVLRGDLANVERIWVDMPIMPLLQSKIHVTALELDQPQILVEVYDDLSTNLIEITADPETTVSETETVHEIALERIRIREGQLAYLHADGTILTVSNLSTDLKARIAETVALSGVIQAGDTYYEVGGIPYADHWNMALQLDALAHLDSTWLRLQTAHLLVEQLDISVTGSLENWDTARMLVDLSLKAPDASVPGFWSLLPASFKKDVAGLEGAGVFGLDATIKGAIAEAEMPQLDAQLTIRDGMIKYPGLPSSIQNLLLDARITNEAIAIRRLSAAAAGAELQLSGTLSDFADPILSADIDLNANLDQVTQYYPLEAGTSLKGRVAVDSKVDGRLSNPAALDATGGATFNEIHYASTSLEQPIENLSGRAMLNGASLDLVGISLKTGQSDLKFDGKVEKYAAFLATEVSPAERPMITGTLTSSYFNATEQLSDDTTSVEPVILPDVLVDVNFIADKLDYNGFHFEQARSRITLNDGVIGFRETTARFFDGLLTANGTFDLSNPLQPGFTANVDLNQLRASRFFTAFTQFDQIARLGQYLDGLFDSAASLQIRMDEAFNPKLETLLAEGTFGASSGVLKGLPLQESLAQHIGVAELKSLPIREWAHRFNISGERLNVQQLAFDAGAFQFGLNGSQGFDGTLDYNLSVELPESAATAFENAPVQAALRPVTQLAGATLINPASGRITLDLKASGTFDKPAFKLNNEMMRSRLTSQATALAASARAEAQARLDSLEQAARMRAEAELAAQKKQLEDQAKKEAEKLIGNLVDSTAITTDLDSLKEKGGEVLKDRLKGLLRKKKN